MQFVFSFLIDQYSTGTSKDRTVIVCGAGIPGIGKNSCPASVSGIKKNDSARKGEVGFKGFASNVYLRSRQSEPGCKGRLRLGGSWRGT